MLVRLRVWNSEARVEALALVDGATGLLAERLALGQQFSRPFNQRARIVLEHGYLRVTRYGTVNSFGVGFGETGWWGKSERRAPIFPSRWSWANFAKQLSPDVRHGHAVKTGEPEGSGEGDLPFVFLHFMQCRNGEAGPLRDLPEGEAALGAQGAKTTVHGIRARPLAGAGMYLSGVQGAIAQRY